MGHRNCSKQKVKRGLWSPEEDEKLVNYITTRGHGSWSSVPKLAGLQRCGKSCRLRWINYLRPDLKRGSFSAQEEQIIIDVHRILGNRWAQIAKHLPGRMDNEVKNFWNSCIKKKLISQGLDPRTHNLIPAHQRSSSMYATKYSFSHNISNSVSPPCHSHQQPFSIITVKDAPMDTNPPGIINVLQSTSIHISNLPQLQNPNHDDLLWAPTLPPPPLEHVHGPSAATFPNCVFSYISDSLENVESAGFGLLSDQGISCINWGSGVAPTLNSDNNNSHKNAYDGEKGQPDHLKETRRTSDMHNIEVGGVGNGGRCFLQEIGAANSFDSSSFDIEFGESTLLSSSAASICRDLTSMDDLAWNF